LVPAREAQALLHRACQEMNQLLPADCKAISQHANVNGGEVIVRFRGLSCAGTSPAFSLARAI